MPDLKQTVMQVVVAYSDRLRRENNDAWCKAFEEAGFDHRSCRGTYSKMAANTDNFAVFAAHLTQAVSDKNCELSADELQDIIDSGNYTIPADELNALKTKLKEFKAKYGGNQAIFEAYSQTYPVVNFSSVFTKPVKAAPAKTSNVSIYAGIIIPLLLKKFP